MHTLQSQCQYLLRHNPVYRPADILGNPAEVSAWYVIRLPDALWILRESDIPRGDFAYRDVEDKAVAILWRKTLEELWAEFVG